MGKRGITVWIFSSLSFLAAIHTLEAGLALFFNTEVILLKLYPIINTLTITPVTYLLASIALTITLWGITCKVAVETPVERFLNKMLSDAKRQSEIECEIVEDNRSVLDMMCETITENNKVLAQTRDITYNVRSELVNLRTLPEKTEPLSVLRKHCASKIQGMPILRRKPAFNARKSSENAENLHVTNNPQLKSSHPHKQGSKSSKKRWE
jgi:hypothetical protein